MFRLRRNSGPYNLLKNLLSVGGVVVLSTFSPVTGSLILRNIISGYFKNKKFQKFRFLQDLRRLQDRKIIDYRVLPDKKISIVVKKPDSLKKLVYDFDALKLDERSWDRKWRLVVFDVPELNKRYRDELREKLKKLNFYMIQKSVYITPYRCENEVDFLCAVFGINRNNVLIFDIKKFEGEEKLRHYFNLN